MKYHIRPTSSGLEIIPADPATRIEFDRLRKDAAEAAEAHLRSKRTEWLTSGPGRRLTEVRAKLRDTEDFVTSMATRVRSLSSEHATALSSGDTDKAATIHAKRVAAMAELDRLRADVKDLRVAVDRADIELRIPFREYLAAERAAFLAEAQARVFAANEVIAEALESAELADVVEAAATVASDAALDRTVTVRMKHDLNLSMTLLKHLSRTDELPILPHGRPTVSEPRPAESFQPQKVGGIGGDRVVAANERE